MLTHRIESNRSGPVRWPWWMLGGALALIAMSACLEGEDLFGNNLDPGFTPCDSATGPDAVTCSPGQHCASETLSECAPGCMNNANCAPPASCVKPGTASVGSCRDHDLAGVDPTQRCIDACAKLFECGALASDEQTQCSNDCQSVMSESDQLDLASCAETWSCTEEGLVACLDLQCGPSFACPAGQDCSAGRCL